MKKTLTKIALASSLALGISGCHASFNYDCKDTLLGSLVLGFGTCSAADKYHFDGKIGNELVRFEESAFGHVHILNVTKEDGTQVEYTDSCGADLKLDLVTIIKDNKTTMHKRNELGYKPIYKYQEEFNNYLKKILVEKQKK